MQKENDKRVSEDVNTITRAKSADLEAAVTFYIPWCG